jgi:hypothetical protein
VNAPVAADAPPAPGDAAGDDRSPRVRRPDADGSDIDESDADAAKSAGAKSAGAESFLAPELNLADILPFTPQIGGAPVPDVAAPGGPAPDGEAMANYGRSSGGPWPLLTGMAVSLALLAFGAAFLWWRNRDTRYWPA